jgi:hypothetical protein
MHPRFLSCQSKFRLFSLTAPLASFSCILNAPISSLFVTVGSTEQFQGTFRRTVGLEDSAHATIFSIYFKVIRVCPEAVSHKRTSPS